MKLFVRLSFSFFLIVLSACNNSTKEPDSLYEFKKYIAVHTQGIQSVKTPITIDLVKPLSNFELDQELPADYLKISPKVTGKLLVQNQRSLIFIPQESLQEDTEYTITLALSELYDDLPQQLKSYTFSFKTLPANFKLNLGNLQSYSKEFQYVDGSILSADVIKLEQAKQLVTAKQAKGALQIVWEEDTQEGTYFNFKIDSISRAEQDTKITVTWDGSAIGSNNNGSEAYPIPGRDNFSVLSVKSSTSPQPKLSINFSDPVADNQNFQGLVQIANTGDLRFEAEGNVLHVYPPFRLVGDHQIEITKGIKNTNGYALKNAFVETITFDQLKPEVRLLSKGTIMPDALNTPIYFETVSLAKVDVRIVEIFQSNMLQFLQESNLNTTDEYYLKRVGRRIAKKTVALTKGSLDNANSWKAHALDLSNVFKANPGSVYRIEISFKPEYSLYSCDAARIDTDQEYYEEEDYYEDYSSENTQDAWDEEALETQYWDNQIYRWRRYTYNWQEQDNPCHPAYYNYDRVVYSNVMASNLGLIVKKANNGSYQVFTTNLQTAQPESGVSVNLYNYQQQELHSLKTDGQGKTIFDTNLNAAFVIAQKGNNYAYARLEDGDALSLSKFDVSGAELQGGLKGFFYTERGVHRPGDSIHLTFVLNDKANPLPENHPVKLEITDPRGKLVSRNVVTQSVNGFYYFPVATSQDDPTGNWNATVKVGGAAFGKTLKVATIKPNRLKIQFDFKDQILAANQPISGTLKSTWLHGAPARNLKANIDLTLSQENEPFTAYTSFVFNDPVRNFYTTEIPLLEGSLSNEGVLKFNQEVAVSKNAPGMLKATFLTKVFEGGGDFSIDVYSKMLAPYSHFVGLRSPEGNAYGSYYTDDDIEFDVASVNDQGKAAANRTLQVKVFRISWRWWWNRGEDNLSQYENSSVYTPVQDFKVTTNAQGKGSFKVNIPQDESGRYLIRVIDPESGHATGRTAYFYRDWWRQNDDSGSDSAKMLVFNSDKPEYTTGERAIINFPSSLGGSALLSIENGSEVLSTQWVPTQEGKTQVAISITEEMAPNVYVNIALLQPHEQTKNDLPIRLYGVIPLLVNNPNTKLNPAITMPDELKPESNYNIKVSEQNGKAMTYTIAVVDEGLLDLTRFSTPAIHQAFYARQSLGVKTFDVFDYVMGAYATSVDNIYAIGGGDAAAGAKNRKADRFKPVVSYLGPFKLEANQTATHKLYMPNYVGQVKTMLVAGDNPKTAYGSAEKVTPVRTPLMVLASVPRKLSPGEKVTIPVTVFAMDKKIRSAAIKLNVGDALKPLNGLSKTVNFDGPGEQMLNFEFEALPTNQVQEIDVTATGHGESASYTLEIDIDNPNPVSQKATNYTLSPKESKTITFNTYGVAGSNRAILEVSTLPHMNLEKRLGYLIRYPHGCVEQTTSGAFPQLFLKDIVALNSNQKQKIEDNLKAAIARLNGFQNASGGLSYWQGESESNQWGTNYGGHFMLEAKAQGYALPVGFLQAWLGYQRKEARQWRNSSTVYNSSLTQAYRLYTLALAGEPELAAMNRLRTSTNLSNDAKWRLGAAYALAGNKAAAQELIKDATLVFTKEESHQYTYGSSFRNKAMALEAMTLLRDKNERDMAISVAAELASDKWLSTQETAYALLAMAKMVKQNGGAGVNLTLNNNGKSIPIQATQVIASQELEFIMGSNRISLQNGLENNLFISLIQLGKYPLGEEESTQRNLTLTTEFLDGESNNQDVANLRQGTEIIAKITVQNNSNDNLQDLALTQLFPSGWEIVNTSFTELGNLQSNSARYTDIKDDRVQYYFDLKAKGKQVFTIKLNASFLGDYYLPGAQVETMYSNNYYARTQGAWVKINR